MDKWISPPIEPPYFWIKLISHTQDRVLCILYSITQNLLWIWNRSSFTLCCHAMLLICYVPKKKKILLSVDSSFLEPFLDPLSELTGINMLWSQSGSRRNLPLLLSCSSLWFTAWYSMSSLSPACPTVASKNSTKAWHNRFQMNDRMAAQCNVDVPPSVVCEALWFSPLEGDRQEKISPSVTRPS